MSYYKIEFSRQAFKSLNSLDKTTKNRISKQLLILSENPRHPELDIKKLQGVLSNYRLRVGNYRVIYTIKDEVLLINIVKIGARGNVYTS